MSPSLKAYGIPGRARLFEVVQKVKEVNANRLREAVRLRKAMYKDGKPSFSSASYDSLSLAADPSLELSYLVAPPRMAYYEKVSRQIYGIYLKYIAPEDIVVYSIDEVFIDATSYLSHYNMTAHDLAMTMIREVLYAITKELRIYTGFINDTGKELPTIIAFEDILEIGVNMT